MALRSFARLVALAAAFVPALSSAVDVDALVDCRVAVERVLHERRDWPATNPASKPPFESIVNRSDLRRDVDAMLDRVAARGERFDAASLQAELERMATNSHDVELLADLFAAAGSGEAAALCLALPALVARDEVDASPTEHADRESIALDVRGVTLPSIRAKGAGGVDMQQEPPDPRYGHAAVWTGAEMIIFGGSNSNRRFRSGARYVPATDTWIPLPLVDAPSPRTLATAVWTGLDAIVFGGHETEGNPVTDHARYRPANDLWGGISSVNAPSGRYQHTAVWTGTSMIVFGGTDGGSVFADGAAYTPASNSWQALPAPPAGNQRHAAAAVWTGTEMLVSGGYSATSSGQLATGLRFVPGTPGVWSSMTNAPVARARHTGLWFGPPVSRFVIWGGDTSGAFGGARYDPVGNAWEPMSSSGAPEARLFHTAVSTGTEMIVWGGLSFSTFAGFDDGARYSPASNTWLGPVQVAGNPGGRQQHSAVWTGDAMIVWGGLGGVPATVPLHSGGRYSPANDAWSATRMPRPCSAYAGNIVPNCGFESGTSGWNTVAIDPYVYRGETRSGRQASAPEVVPEVVASVASPCVPISGSQRYDFGLYHRISGGNIVGCGLNFLTYSASNCDNNSFSTSTPGSQGLVLDAWKLGRSFSVESQPFDVAARMFLRCSSVDSPGTYYLHVDDGFIIPLGADIFADGFE